MKKTYAFLAAVCLAMSLVISIQSPINMTNDFVLNGNALSEDKGFERNIGMQYEENQTLIEEASSDMKEQVSNTITNTAKVQGNSKSFNIEYVPLVENKVANIGTTEKYTEKKEQSLKTEEKEDVKQPPKTEKPANTEPVEENILKDFDPNSTNVKALGEFKLTAYCPCYSCSEGYGSNTATGNKAKENHTIAVNPKVIPYGSIVVIEIDGVYRKYVAEDCGGAIKNKKIDIYFTSHSKTTNFGVRKGNVYIITQNSKTI